MLARLQLTEGLHLKDDNWNFVSVDNSEQGTWPRVKGFELQEDKVQRMPPWRYLGLEIGKRTIVPQKLEIKAKIQTLADVHQLCGALNWCDPSLVIPDLLTHCLFSWFHPQIKDAGKQPGRLCLGSYLEVRRSHDGSPINFSDPLSRVCLSISTVVALHHLYLLSRSRGSQDPTGSDELALPAIRTFPRHGA
ncbi:hypothetical protein DUI87_03407 [Hirundo rustica rustica]|uniref:Reverse transcriptase thumb domain-containing protein n=1 Tax=Hirundo rustica rustica TaxID=333673 RepID=A0A3M0L2P5_HIRRU|nr:hypothetical protein DUI87_03407 [Hirundo rustica rustica]